MLLTVTEITDDATRSHGPLYLDVDVSLVAFRRTDHGCCARSLRPERLYADLESAVAASNYRSIRHDAGTRHYTGVRSGEEEAQCRRLSLCPVPRNEVFLMPLARC